MASSFAASCRRASEPGPGAGANAPRNRAARWVAALIGAATLVAAPVHAGTDVEGQGWFLNTARGPLYGDWKLYLEVQPRVDGDGVHALLLRPAVGYQVTRSWSLWQGYAWTPSFQPYRSENRIFQQSVVDTPPGVLPVALTNRTRLEERWLDGAGGVSLRARHMLRVVYPLDAAGRWGLAAYDEPFVTLNDTNGGPRAGFDQNRAFAGVNRELAPGLRLEVGYLNQFVNSASGRPDLLRHVALVWLDLVW